MGGVQANRIGNYLENGFRSLADIVVPEAQNAEPLLLQPFIARGVQSLMLIQPVLPAIKFDDQTTRQIREVYDEGPDRSLPTEMRGLLAVQQRQERPKLAFMHRCIAPQTPRTVAHLRMGAHPPTGGT